MDGENNGKPFWNGWFGGTIIFGNTQNEVSFVTRLCPAGILHICSEKSWTYCWWQPEIRDQLTSWGRLVVEIYHDLRRVFFAPSKRWVVFFLGISWSINILWTWKYDDDSFPKNRGSGKMDPLERSHSSRVPFSTSMIWATFPAGWSPPKR